MRQIVTLIWGVVAWTGWKMRIRGPGGEFVSQHFGLQSEKYENTPTYAPKTNHIKGIKIAVVFEEGLFRPA